MDYKELLDRYKKGLLSEKERKLVEEELEKKFTFEEYMSESLDEEILPEDLDEKKDISHSEYHEEETNKLKKSVNKRLRRVVISSVLIVVILYFGIFYLISGIVDLAYYDPRDVTQSEKNGHELPDFHYDMQAYISLNIPGQSMSSFTSEESVGFGDYQVSYFMRDLFAMNEQRYFADIRKGKGISELDGIFSWEKRFGNLEAFEKIQFPVPGDEDDGIRDDFIEKNNEKTIRYLNELNPLSYISMSILFDKDLNMSEFMNMSDKQKTLDYKWLGVRTVEPGTRWSENQPMHLIGFNPNSNNEPSNSYQKPDFEKYPYFYLRDMWDSSLFTEKGPVEGMAKAYEMHFKSRLQYLQNREGFVKIFDYNEYKVDFYNQSLEYIDENGVKTYGVLVYGTARDFLDYIDEIPYDSIYINEVLPINPNVYYD